ncbi:DUF6624 domain-containing protein [Terricaulis sp.]|uniref:DUF6624 domain-containing protein n=1 Tax=Terricaulis sp. TaxID=2768686 RepID=UPI003782DB73
MRALVAAGLALACISGAAFAQPATPDELAAAFDQKLERGERIVGDIAAMYARDQFVRQLIMEGFRQEMTSETREAYIARTQRHFDRIDGENTRRLQGILRRVSWEELMAISPRAADQAFSIVSHSRDLAFKRSMLDVFEPLARAGRMPGDRVALLVDDVALEEGRGQVYGTNFECHHGAFMPKPIEDPEHLAERRAALGLSTMEQYTAEQVQLYGACPD